MSSSTMQKVECLCLFDITSTAVNRNQRNVQYPYKTKTGLQITDANTLIRARNQQRNFDTILQLLGLRTQIFNATDSVLTTSVPEQFAWAGSTVKVWSFDFEIEPQSQWTVDNDDFGVLKSDSDQTPMLVGLTETAIMDPWLTVQGNNTNIIYHAKIYK